jgi:hypothetical protein
MVAKNIFGIFRAVGLHLRACVCIYTTRHAFDDRFSANREPAAGECRTLGQWVVKCFATNNAAAVLIFLLSLGEIGVPMYLRFPVYPTECAEW